MAMRNYTWDTEQREWLRLDGNIPSHSIIEPVSKLFGKLLKLTQPRLFRGNSHICVTVFTVEASAVGGLIERY